MSKLKQVFEAMMEFQKKNDIKNECVGNAVYLRNYLLSIGVPAKVKAVATYHTNDELEAHCLTCHMVVDIDQGILDPSYDISRHNAKYFDELHNIKGFMGCLNEGLTPKEFVSKFINFIDMANKLNNKGFTITDSVYYDKLHDNISRMLKQ